MKTFPIRIEDDLHRRARHAAIDEGMSLQQWILKAIAKQLPRNEQKKSGAAYGHNDERTDTSIPGVRITRSEK